MGRKVCYCSRIRGDGIQKIIKDASDEVIKINISKNVESLNVTSALSICLFQKKRPKNKLWLF